MVNFSILKIKLYYDSIILKKEREEILEKIKLCIYKNNLKIDDTYAFVGRNGITNDKKEGDGKTPSGKFKLGVAFGIHSKEEIKIPFNIKYIQITPSLYWVDDVNSIYYNKLVDIEKQEKDWNSAEHLVEYPKQYEYAIEIISNKENIPGKRKCNFFTL